MTEHSVAPTGLGRRRRRLSDEETQERMLQAALDMVNRAGLTVSLEHIGLEDVIREAGVARSAVYRRWPYKDLFFSDLLRELAKGASPAIAGVNPEAVEQVGRIVLDHLDWLETPELRMALLAEILRRQALAEFGLFQSSAEWRTYYALHATFLSLPEGELRDDVQAKLSRSERDQIAAVAGAYERGAALLGLRLRPEAGVTFETVASMAGAATRGLVIMSPANPGIASERFMSNPYGAPEPAEWSQPALAVAGVIMTFLEPDPDWSSDQLDAAKDALANGTWAAPAS